MWLQTLKWSCQSQYQTYQFQQIRIYNKISFQKKKNLYFDMSKIESKEDSDCLISNFGKQNLWWSSSREILLAIFMNDAVVSEKNLKQMVFENYLTIRFLQEWAPFQQLWQKPLTITLSSLINGTNPLNVGILWRRKKIPRKPQFSKKIPNAYCLLTLPRNFHEKPKNFPFHKFLSHCWL